MAFRGRFRFLEGQWYLEVTPTYRFTHDGYGLDRFHEDRLKGIKLIEGYRAVLNSVLFWADYLRPKETLFGVRAPALEFGNGGTHVDIRYGLMRHGPLDLGETAPPLSSG
jgi:hypothetical protein